MIVRFLTDENFNRKILHGLRSRLPLCTILRAQDVGLRTLNDPAILEWAEANEFILLSHDERTMRGHVDARIEAGLRNLGVFIVRQDVPIRLAIEEVEIIAQCSSTDEWLNQVRFIPLRPS